MKRPDPLIARTIRRYATLIERAEARRLDLVRMTLVKLRAGYAAPSRIVAEIRGACQQLPIIIVTVALLSSKDYRLPFVRKKVSWRETHVEVLARSPR